MATNGDVARYIRAIRNDAKRRYAKAYLLHLTCGHPCPEDPEDLSYMGAQAVRIALGDMLRKGA